jgi:hypothetical protein
VHCSDTNQPDFSFFIWFLGLREFIITFIHDRKTVPSDLPERLLSLVTIDAGFARTTANIKVKIDAVDGFVRQGRNIL